MTELERTMQRTSKFEYLVNKYNEKGYMVENIHKNIFKPSPILMEDSEMNKFYKYGGSKKINDKDLFLIHRVQMMVKSIAPSNKDSKSVFQRKGNLTDREQRKHLKKIEYLNKEIVKNSNEIRNMKGYIGSSFSNSPIRLPKKGFFRQTTRNTQQCTTIESDKKSSRTNISTNQNTIDKNEYEGLMAEKKPNSVLNNIKKKEMKKIALRLVPDFRKATNSPSKHKATITNSMSREESLEQLYRSTSSARDVKEVIESKISDYLLENQVINKERIFTPLFKMSDVLSNINEFRNKVKYFKFNNTIKNLDEVNLNVDKIQEIK